MRDAFNRTIDQLEAFGALWIHTHPVPFLAITVGVIFVGYAYKIYVYDNRS
jgi:hypothetical protein